MMQIQNRFTHEGYLKTFEFIFPFQPVFAQIDLINDPPIKSVYFNCSHFLP